MTHSSDARVLIAVCTYQEAGNIRPLLASLRSSLPDADVLIVDDDSPDGTADLVRQVAAEDSAVRLLLRTEKRGLGNAIQAAIGVAIDDGYDFLLNLDGDLSHDPQSLPRLLDVAVNDPEIDVVVGSRYVDGGQIVGWPLRRRWMSRLVNRFAITMLGLPVRDCSGSMRCYRVSALAKLKPESLRCQGYALLEELLVRLNANGSRMVEVPITFTERQRGHSKLTLGEAVRSVSSMIRLALKSKSV
ncbi:polyprenol monophosphomannose synthase [Stieleria varia]|uniref:Undecaprenyl-phosphate mannosyltransferase n=1 Tax=Stieleria varia TaxID=2528005 RepID=A0A5C6B391_9BACT|nr:polyprenol monophosphomannose synthase [Stieleria varia]TWU05982.1 Undecaprenyl-phosphate mannosyltransferase [Stieleria varia]